MNTYEFEFDVIKISLIFLIAFCLFSLFIFRSFAYKHRLIYPLVLGSALGFINAYLFIFKQIEFPNLIPSISLAIGPLLLAFSKSILTEKPFYFKKEIPHYLPSIALLILSLVPFDRSIAFSYYIAVFVTLHFGVYLLIAINRLIAKKVVVLRATDHQNFSSAKWVNLFNVLLTISFIYITAFIEVFTSDENTMRFRFVLIACVLGCIFLLLRNFILNMFHAYSAYKKNKSIRVIEKYKDSVLTKGESERLATKLEDIMQNSKPYREEAISSKTLSIALKTHPKILSQVINENFEKNFFDYINSYRIEDAKRMLADMQYEEFKIYEIMYEVGFNSRSSFNTAFKKNTGITAKQFRERNLYK